jgi:hypothetical protein
MNFEATRLQVGVERIAMLAKIKNDAVAVSFIQRNVGRILTRRLLRLSVGGGGNYSVGYG